MQSGTRVTTHVWGRPPLSYPIFEIVFPWWPWHSCVTVIECVHRRSNIELTTRWSGGGYSWAWLLLGLMQSGTRVTTHVWGRPPLSYPISEIVFPWWPWDSCVTVIECVHRRSNIELTTRWSGGGYSWAWLLLGLMQSGTRVTTHVWGYLAVRHGFVYCLIIPTCLHVADILQCIIRERNHKI